MRNVVPPEIVQEWLTGEPKMRDKCSGCVTPCDECVTDNSASEVVDEAPNRLEQWAMSHQAYTGNDPVNHPEHYTSHPSGVEVIQITEHMNFCLGNAIKYILRADLKGNREQDLKKAMWYLQRELDRGNT